MVDELQVGVITGTHGIKGLVKVYPLTDDPARFNELEEVILHRPDGQREELRIKQVRMHKGMVLLSFEGLEDINLVECFKDSEIFVRRENASPLEEDEYYYADLIGMEVILITGDSERKLGEITDIIETGPNQVFAVKTTEGREQLIPSIRDCIKEVDVEGGIMKVQLLPGMEDL